MKESNQYIFRKAKKDLSEFDQEGARYHYIFPDTAENIMRMVSIAIQTIGTKNELPLAELIALAERVGDRASKKTGNSWYSPEDEELKDQYASGMLFSFKKKDGLVDLNTRSNSLDGKDGLPDRVLNRTAYGNFDEILAAVSVLGIDPNLVKAKLNQNLLESIFFEKFKFTRIQELLANSDFDPNTYSSFGAFLDANDQKDELLSYMFEHLSESEKNDFLSTEEVVEQTLSNRFNIPFETNNQSGIMAVDIKFDGSDGLKQLSSIHVNPDLSVHLHTPEKVQLTIELTLWTELDETSNLDDLRQLHTAGVNMYQEMLSAGSSNQPKTSAS